MRDNKRIRYFDIAKGIAIICVIIGHFVSDESFIKRIIATFHMPIFFIISGYFYRYLPNKEFIKKKFKQLVIPYFATAAVIILMSIIKDFIKSDFTYSGTKLVYYIGGIVWGSGLKKSFLNYDIFVVGAIWFLIALFEALVILNLLNKVNEKVKSIIVIAIFLLGYFSAKVIWLPLSIQAGMCATFFVYIGYLVKKYDIINKIENMSYKKIFDISMFIIWIMGIYFNVRVSMVQNYYSHGILSIIVAIVATYCVIQLSKYIENLNIISKPLELARKKFFNNIMFSFNRINIFSILFNK